MSSRRGTPRLLRRTDPAPSPLQQPPGGATQQPPPGATLPQQAPGGATTFPEPLTARSMEANVQLLEKNTFSSEVLPGASNMADQVLPPALTRPASALLLRQGSGENTVQRLVVIQPNESPSTATANAIRQVTDELNQRAAERIAEGRTPEKETLIEITQIGQIGDSNEGYFSRERLQKQRQQQPGIFSHLKLHQPSSRQRGRRDSAHRARDAQTPSPVQGDLSVECVEMASPYEPTPRPATPMDTSPVEVTIGPDGSRCPVEGGQGRLHGSLSVQGRALSLQGRQRRRSETGQSPVTVISCRPGQRIECPPAVPAASSRVFKTIPVKEETSTDLDDSLTNIQWLTEGEVPAAAPKKEVKVTPVRAPLVRPIPSKVVTRPGPIVRLAPLANRVPSPSPEQEIPRDLDRSQRPPYSYMHLIQLAICSTEDRRMTLKQIYQWIEDTFPYYRYSSKPGWKNSIRHNLSLYDRFVREKSLVPGNVGASYWTVRPEHLVKPYRPPPQPKWLEGREGAESPGLCVSERQRRKAPPLLLPKGVPRQVHSPTPGGQRYTLVPLPSGVSMVMGDRSLVVTSPVVVADGKGGVTLTPAEDRGSKLPNIMRRAAADDKTRLLKRSSSPACVLGPMRKQVKIAPRPLPRTASAALGAPLPEDPDFTLLRDPSEDLSSAGSTAEDSGVCLTPNTSQEFLPNSMVSGLLPSAQNSVVPGLPKPTLYKQRSRRKDTHEVLMVDLSADSAEKVPLATNQSSRRSSTGSCDVATDAMLDLDLLSGLEDHAGQPLLRTPPRKTSRQTHKTSTPTKTTPDWISPMRDLELTPLSAEPSLLIDSGIFTPPDGQKLGPDSGDADLLTESPSGHFISTRSPGDGSLRDLGLPGYTPLKSGPLGAVDGSPHGLVALETSPQAAPNQSFTRMFGDINLDKIIEQGMDVDVANLSFSAFQ